MHWCQREQYPTASGTRVSGSSTPLPQALVSAGAVPHCLRHWRQQEQHPTATGTRVSGSSTPLPQALVSAGVVVQTVGPRRIKWAWGGGGLGGGDSRKRARMHREPRRWMSQASDERGTASTVVCLLHPAAHSRCFECLGQPLDIVSEPIHSERRWRCPAPYLVQPPCP